MARDHSFHRPTRLESIYRHELDRLFSRYFTFPTTATLGEINARLVEFAHARNFFSTIGQKMANRMITMVANNNAVSWRQAATTSSNGRIIYQMLKRDLQANTLVGIRLNNLITDNSNLISSVPENVQYKLAKWIQEQQVKGIRSSEIAKQLRPRLNYIKSYEVARIARTEVAKADTAITHARAESMGLNYYQWLTSKDSRVRPGHKVMNLVLVNWNDAPAPELLAHEKSEGYYHAGNIWNCRCIALPLTSLSEITWPCKVYINNSIKQLTRNQFMLVSGMPKELAA
jgi:SPP1 gp7 family putative phage head morphogenesis protein